MTRKTRRSWRRLTRGRAAVARRGCEMGRPGGAQRVGPTLRRGMRRALGGLTVGRPKGLLFSGKETGAGRTDQKRRLSTSDASSHFSPSRAGGLKAKRLQRAKREIRPPPPPPSSRSLVLRRWERGEARGPVYVKREASCPREAGKASRGLRLGCPGHAVGCDWNALALLWLRSTCERARGRKRAFGGRCLLPLIKAAGALGGLQPRFLS